MRDLETIQLALTAAETGHIVFGTLHTSSAPKTVDRVIDVFPPNQQAQIRAQFAESIEAVITQTLLKKKAGGRVAAHEIMIGTTAVRNSNSRRKDPSTPRHHAGKPKGWHADDGHGAAGPGYSWFGDA